MAEQDSGAKRSGGLSQEQRKLAAEAYRRPLALESEDPLRQLQTRQIYFAEELKVWSYAQRRVQRGIAAHTTALPNVTLHHDLVVAASFSPGHLFAVDKRSGERLWMRRLSTYGVKPVSVGEHLLCGDYRMLLSLEPQTGKQIWKFQPGDDNGEYLFSTPVYANGAVFIGDWLGYLTCLDAPTGKIRWSVPAEPGRRSWVNATALPYEDLVITATNSEVALAYDQATGLLYESLEQGLGIVDVTSGRRLTLIQGLATKQPRDWAGLPDADAGRLYVLHAAGMLWALQHPYML